MRLSHSDLTRLFEAVEILTDDADPATMPARTDAAVRHAVSTDVVSFEAFGNDQDYRGPLWYSPEGSVPLERLKFLAEHVFEHPLVADALVRRVNRAVTVSDYQTLTQFKRTALYNEFFRSIGTDRQMTVGLGINPSLVITTSLCRLRRDFSPRDRAAMEMLTPHLIAAFRTSQFVLRMKGEHERSVPLESAHHGFLTLNEDLESRIECPKATALLQKYFQPERAFLPESLRRWVGHQLENGRDSFDEPITPFEVITRSGSLKINVTYHPASGSAALYLQERLHPIDHLCGEYKLTVREAEVLRWIGKGKTDGEIGALLDISVRTVQKHVEHIFEKLGTETRTAAASFLQNR